MRGDKPGPYDLVLSVVLTVAGGALVILALLNHWNPNEMNPGIEGSLTAVALCPIFAALHGLSYWNTVKLCAPVLVIEYVVCRAVGAPTYAVMGIGLLVVGFVGFLSSLRGSGEAARRRPLIARRRATSSEAVAH